jgi:two-component SAPR family response regulator
MRTIIIDDERPSLELLKRIIEKNRHFEIVGEFTDAASAIDQMESLLPDVVFTDVEMPFLNGIDFASLIKRNRETVQIVFVTAYENYALDAFEVNAVNYILKPITEESLNKTAERLMKYYSPKEEPLQQNKRNKIISLGSFQVYGREDGRRIKWPTSKVKELFAYFLWEKGRELDKWQLCEILWPDAPPKKASHSLHSTVNRMKVALRDAGIETSVECKNGRYRMDVQNLFWDAEEVVSYFKKNPVVTKENVFQFEQMLELYQGELFETEDYIWAEGLRENIKKRYLEAHNCIANYYMECKNYHQVERHLQKMIVGDPGDEKAAMRLMELYFITGNKVKLMQSYHRLDGYLKNELHIDPKESTKVRYQEFIANMQKL